MNKRVLICEDDCAIRFLFDKILTRRGLSADCDRVLFRSASRPGRQQRRGETA